MHITRPIFSTQFHPEAQGGPMDTAFLFEIYLSSMREYKGHQYRSFPGSSQQIGRLLSNILGSGRSGVSI